MALEIEAVYENGLLKPDEPLPLHDGQRVKVTIQKTSGRARSSAGIFRWQGDRKDLEYHLGPDNHPWNDDP